MTRRIQGRAVTRRDNADLTTKTALRLAAVDALATDRLNILDAYTGNGTLWSAIRNHRPNIQFNITRIDRRTDLGPDVIAANNVKVMPTLLTNEQFDLIDLDAYGVPYEQLALAAAHAPHVPVIITCATTNFGAIPNVFLDASGIPHRWSRDILTVFKRVGILPLWDTYCATLGYTRRIGHTYRQRVTKRYDILVTDQAPQQFHDPTRWNITT